MAITVEINGKTYTFRNLEEQVLFVTKELTKVQQSLGNALPDPIQGPQGEPGASGAPGPVGPRGTGIFGCTALLPSPTAYKEGDLYVLFSGDLYRKINGSWVLQTNLKGPQGAPGLVGGSEVVANPVSSPTDDLYKVSIDGTIYNVLSSTARTYLDNLQDYFQYDSNDEYFAFLKEAYFDQLVTFDKRVNFDGDVYFRNNTLHLSALSQLVDISNNPIVICENFKDANGNARFVEGNLTTETVSGVTFTYAKWSLSGTHLMIVLCGEIANGTTIGVVNLASAELPDYIKNKIVGVFATNYITIHDDRAYYDDWNSVSLQNALYKTDDGLGILQIANPTTTQTAHFRIQYDLIIDMA